MLQPFYVNAHVICSSSILPLFNTKTNKPKFTDENHFDKH